MICNNINIFDSTKIQQIKPQNKTMIWCTCAQLNQKQYFKRVQAWYKQVKLLNVSADFFVFNDGRIIQDVNEYQFDGLNFVVFPNVLGRKNITIFPGFKRNFYYALLCSRKYDNFIHLQSDAYINKLDIFYDNYQKPNICAYCYNENCNFMQSVFMILNNKSVIQLLIDTYSDFNLFYQNVIFQRKMQELINCDVCLGTSWRRQKYNDHEQSYEIISQCQPQYILKLLKQRKSI